MRQKSLGRHEKRSHYPEIEKERKLYRLLLILRKAGEVLYVRELSNEFGVSERSIERDLMALEGAGFGLENVAKGAYAFVETNLLPPRRRLARA
jgi:predicted DNA-binding transcriptional regulator YafY